VGKVIGKYKTAKHFDVAITDDSLTVIRRQAQIDAEAGPGRDLRDPHARLLWPA
jgi:hypothetical protein